MGFRGHIIIGFVRVNLANDTADQKKKKCYIEKLPHSSVCIEKTSSVRGHV